MRWDVDRVLLSVFKIVADEFRVWVDGLRQFITLYSAPSDIHQFTMIWNTYLSLASWIKSR